MLCNFKQHTNTFQTIQNIYTHSSINCFWPFIVAYALFNGTTWQSMAVMASKGPSPQFPSLHLGLPAYQSSKRHHAQSLLGPSFHDPRTLVCPRDMISSIKYLFMNPLIISINIWVSKSYWLNEFHQSTLKCPEYDCLPYWPPLLSRTLVCRVNRASSKPSRLFLMQYERNLNRNTN